MKFKKYLYNNFNNLSNKNNFKLTVYIKQTIDNMNTNEFSKKPITLLNNKLLLFLLEGKTRNIEYNYKKLNETYLRTKYNLHVDNIVLSLRMYMVQKKINEIRTLLMFLIEDINYFFKKKEFTQINELNFQIISKANIDKIININNSIFFKNN